MEISKEEREIIKKITDEIEKQGRTIKWMAKNLNLSGPSLSQRLSGKVRFKYHEIENIKILLDADW